MKIEQENKCFDCGHRLDGENCVAGGVHNKPKKDIEQEIMEMFDNKFVVKSNAGTDLLRYTDANLIKSFISHIITLVQNREREEIVEKTMKIDRYYSNPKGKPMIYIEELNNLIKTK